MSSIDPNLDKFIGVGLVFPIILDDKGGANIEGGFNLINASIKSILSWMVGTRFFLGEYGSKLELLIEEPNDNVLQATLEHYTKEALENFETRINVLTISFERKDIYTINITMIYQLINTDIRNTFIFPYYSQLTY